MEPELTDRPAPLEVMMSETKLKAGQMVMFATGSYSDYRVNSVVVVRKPFDLAKQLDRFVKDVLKTGEYQYPEANSDTFIGWLCANDFIASVACSEIHIGGTYDIELPCGKSVNCFDVNEEAGRRHPEDSSND